MREYIFDFKQTVAIKQGISIEQLLILDYLIKFFDSGNAVTKNINGKKFCWVSYSKLISDLPILNIKEREFRRILTDLQNKQIIERTTIANKMFIYLNQKDLYFLPQECGEDFLTDKDEEMLECARRGQKCPRNGDCADENDRICGQNCPIIVNYYKNKIKILCDDARIKFIDGEKLSHKLKTELKKELRPLAYDICVKGLSVMGVSENLIIIKTDCASILKENTNGKFEEVVKTLLTSMLESDGLLCSQ